MDRGLNGRHLNQPHQYDVDPVLECLCIFITHKGLPASRKALVSKDRRLRHINLAFDVLISQGLKTLKICTSRSEVLQAPIVLQMSDLVSSCHKLLLSQSFGSEMAHTEGRSNASSNQTYTEIKMKEMEMMYTQQGNGTLSMLIKDSEVSRSTHLSVSHPHHPNHQAKHFYKKEDSGGGVASGGGRGLCTTEGGVGLGEVGPQDSSVSFNREQIIVEVNLNNQTLNVSKGSDGTSALHVPMEEGKEQDDNEDDEGEYEHEKEDSDEDEEENDLNIPEVGHASMERPQRASRLQTAVGTRQTLIGTALERVEGRRRREQESSGQKVKLEERQHYSCKKCPRVFNNRWYLEKHMNVTHNRMQICNKCGKRFLLESELLLHHQTNCEKNIQVHIL